MNVPQKHDQQILSMGLSETIEFGKALGMVLQKGHVVGLTGELGSGKTAFVRGVTCGLEVEPSCYVSSPTFTLVNEYAGRILIYHIDLYRLKTKDEVYDIGLDDYYGSSGVCLVEWFDRFLENKPSEYMELFFSIQSEHARTIDILCAGNSYKRLLEEWMAMIKSL